MRFNQLKSTLNTAVLAVTILLLGASTSFAQSVSLTAGSSVAVLPDGQSVPMWGYSCSTVTLPVGATCAAANPNAAGNWSPVVITVAPGPLTITLTNALPAPVAETSLVMVGQLGGGLGGAPTVTPSPAHNPQGTTWPIAATGPTFTPPPQADRVQSFGTPATHTTAAILPWANLKSGTYLIESGTHPSIQGTMGLYGVLVVTTAPAGTTAGCAYPGASSSAACVVPYNAEVPLVLSEIDPVQNAAVAKAVTLAGFSETTVWSGQPGGCGNPSTTPVTGNCYPPAVNYDPRYYLINGVSLDRTNIARSLFAANPVSAAPAATDTTLVRFVNAGSRMHVPSIVGPTTGTPAVPGFSLIAEDGNVLPGVPRVQSEVFLAAGKTYDVMINSPAAATLPVFDRQLSLSSNNQRDGGMTAYIGLAGSTTTPAGLSSATVLADTYILPPGATSLSISDPAKGVIANDIGVYGVTLNAAVTQTGGAATLNPDGTFTFAATATSGSFGYCANGSTTLCTTVAINACTGACKGAAPTAVNDAYTSNISTRFQLAPPGVLENDTDPQGHPLTAGVATNVVGGTVSLNPDGSFIATGTSSAPLTFQYTAVNSQGTASTAATVTVNFLAGSGLAVSVFDAPSFQQSGTAAAKVTDYRWIIEEDRTFNIDPTVQNTGGTTVPSFGTNFHTSYMPVVASGCTGPVACEAGQTVSGQATVCDVGNGGCRKGGTGVPTQQALLDPAAVHLESGKRYYISILPGDAGNDFTAGGGAPKNGTANLTRTGKTITASNSTTPTGLNVGDTITISGASDPKANGVCKVTSVTDTPTSGHFSCTLTTQLAVTGTGSSTGAAFTHQFSIAEDCGTYSLTASNAGNWTPGSGTCGHGMGGANIVAPLGATAFPPVNVTLEETPFPTAKIAVFVFEDDSPLNGENDVHGGSDTGGTSREPGLGGFEITLFDDAGGTGDPTGQMTYDMFNYPLSNSLANTVDQLTHQNACPISTNTDSLVGMIVTCPHFEDDGITVSPLAGQAVIANMMPGRYGVVANEGADRAARGEEWLQTNTLDGQKAHDSFMKIGGPAYFQEFGPAGFHVSVGFANPKIINDRLAPFCTALGAGHCGNTITGLVTDMHQSRTPDQRLYSSGDRNALGFTQCYVSVGDPDEDDFAFTKCNSDGTFTLTGLPDGDWRITLIDQWNDQILDGLSTPVRLGGGNTVTMQIPVQQWHTNIYTRSYIDVNKDGVSNVDNQGNATEPGLTLLPTNIRFRDGSYSNFNNTDLNGFAGFNEIFPLFNWYVIEADTTRFKQTGVHVVYDAGGPVDGNGGGSSNIASSYANTIEPAAVALPTALRFPGSVYCADADCTADNLLNHAQGGGPGGSTGRIDPPWVTSEAWQGFIGENEFVEFGKTPFAPGENGGIHGEVIYASTRPFDDPSLLIHTSWTPDVPNVRINLYQETTAADGTISLSLVDHTLTTSWDDWAQGFRVPGVGTTPGIPNMNCPGQDPLSLFFFTLQDSTEWLNPATVLPNRSQYKCYDGLSNFNQVQPAPYDGYYHFPSVTTRNSTTGAETGTNCTVCAANPTGDGTQMLPKGKYVVEMIVPPGYELVKEEDKNILIGDNYIAPVTQQFGGLGSIFILPDQAEVSASVACTTSSTYACNPQQSTQSLGRTTYPSQEGDTGSVETFWPCVGLARTVPDFISLFPQSGEVSPFAGATRNLCDRKEVNLDDQTAPLAKFWVFSSTHVAAHFTGIMLDDLSSEFDPFSPQFGEKFAIPNVPISFKDHYGLEVSRTYSDEWGLFNGLNYSTWEVNPPNPTGYAPTMMVACMNDPGPIPDPAHPGQVITDPLFNPNYSQFCYEIPFMPGQTQYMDTPVVPTAAFADGYNLPDCAYPAATPAVSTVTGPTVLGPWVPAAGATLTINALGDQIVPNQAYSGPKAATAPFNQKFITRHYGFGGTAGTVALVGSDGVSYPLTGVSWSDLTITGAVPSGLPVCTNGAPLPSGVTAATAMAKWGACGELVITTAPSTAYPLGQQSIDTVTVTVGGKAPTVISAENAASNAIQTALDAATPGDLIIVRPGSYNEMLLMWKPVRLQGVGAASVSVNANTHPSGKMDAWRRKVDCLFGLSLNGGSISAGNPFDPSGASSCAFVATTGTNAGLSVPQVDPLPLEPIAGWDPSLNGNIAELLQEPTLMGAYEGAAITVLGKGVSDVTVGTGANAVLQYDPNCTANGICVPLTNSAADCSAYPSNFLCNPSRVDGISFVNSSAGGGGIFLHGYNHYTEVANNRVHSNGGTLSGGITVGQAETPDATIAGTQEVRFGFNINTNVHNNSVTQNSSYGDEINSTSTMAAGGVTFCTGADNYKFNHNWVCGNLSTGDGGGFVHFGFSYNGNISNNWFLFNQSNNISLSTNGGGLVVMGAPPDGTVCENSLIDVDCPPQLSDGAGPNLVIDANLFLGNTAESGSGGGMRLQNVNGTDVLRNPTNPGNWYGISVTNNIISNNVAGWDGAGVSLQDALKVSFINNTVVSNDSTASSGVLFNTLGAPNSNNPPPTNGGGNCNPLTDPTCSGNQIVTSTPQPSGLVTTQNTPNLTTQLPATVNCPANFGYSGGTGTGGLVNGNCRTYSSPRLQNDLFWQNRTFNIQVGGLGTGPLSQQNLVTLLPQLNQASTGACATATGGTGNYWDIGVRGDTGPTNHNSGLTLATTATILSTGGNPNFIRQYCNGARVAPENGGLGYDTPPGISDATTPNPVFNLTPAATVDEGNNWINMAFGPLSLVNNTLATLPGTTTAAPQQSLGNYSISTGSSAFNTGVVTGSPNHDFFGTSRPQAGGFDVGAVELVGPNAAAIASVTPGSLAFGNVATGTSSPAQTLTLHNTGNANLTVTTLAFTTGYARATFAQGGGGTCGTTPITLTPATATCTIRVVFTPTGLGATSGSSLTITANVAVSGSPVGLSGTGVAPVRSATLTPSPWSPTAARGIGTAGPTQIFTFTNTGNVNATGVTAGTLGGTNSGAYAILTTGTGRCGTPGNTTLAPNATCSVTVRFQPAAAPSPTGVKSATLSVSYGPAPTQTASATLSGTAQ